MPQQSDGEGIDFDWMRGEALMALANLSLFLPPLSGRPQVRICHHIPSRPVTSRHIPSHPVTLARDKQGQTLPIRRCDGSPQPSLAAHSPACFVLRVTYSSWSCMCMRAHTDHDTSRHIVFVLLEMAKAPATRTPRLCQYTLGFRL